MPTNEQVRVRLEYGDAGPLDTRLIAHLAHDVGDIRDNGHS